MFDVAIIGNGASVVATLKALSVLSAKKNILIKICIVGQISNLGYGVAYNEDNDCAIMNTPASNISIDPEDPLEFIKWSKRNGFAFYKHHNVPRRIYGKYLYDTAMKLITGHKIIIFDAYACDISKKNNNYEILTSDNNEILTKRIILCAGVSKMNDFYKLSGFYGYISNPYPLHHQLSFINKNECILVLGSGLTAVDIAVYLFSFQHRGKIIICSREGRLPVVKSILRPYRPKWCRFDFFTKIFETQKVPLTLRQVLRVIRRELKSINADWIKIFFPKEPDSESTFMEKIKAAKKGIPWLDVLVGIQHEIDQTWSYVKNEHKSLFIEKYLPNVLKAIAPMPLKNANILCELFLRKQLEIVDGVTSIQNINNSFVIQRGNKLPLQVNHVINATGFNRHISINDESLISKLIKKELIHSHPSGGIQVCPKTGRVTPDERIFSVGHLTMGEHPLINNIELIVMNAKATATAVINGIKYESEFFTNKVASAF